MGFSRRLLFYWLRAAGAARKGGTPGEGSPFTPSCASLAQGAFRALRRAAMGSAPGPRPLFCTKAGQKTFKRQSTASPNPSPLGRVIQSVREADTLAAEWQLPREWERRVGPETSRGRHHPKRLSLGKTKEMGWNMQHQPKVQQGKTASSSNPRQTDFPSCAPANCEEEK